MPALSVIIPTHHRPELLKKALDLLAKQTIADTLEVIVVHDGTDDAETKQMMEGVTIKVERLEYFSIPKSHQGVARNRGVEKATTPTVLFIQDDIFLDEKACETHLLNASRFPGSACLGFTTWDPECGITSVMRWLERVGWQFGYPHIMQYAHKPIPKAEQQNYAYTSHISLPTDIAKQIRFREDVTLYGWEDIEWGMRLKQADVSLIYEPGARALHHHHLEMEDSLRRIELLGRSAVIMNRIDPSLGIVPRGLKRMIYKLIAMLPTIWGRHAKALMTGIEQGEH